MRLIFLWISFIYALSCSEYLTHYQYFVSSIFMFYFIYLLNNLYEKHVSSRIFIVFLTIPSAIFWYIAFVYNDFLCLTPLSYELFMVLFFNYIYLMVHLFWSISTKHAT
jgi:hypothetical protein